MRGYKYYVLRPTVLCEYNGDTFERGIQLSGQLGLYLGTKLTEGEARDLIFYLERKMPFIRGINALAFSIYECRDGEDHRTIAWSGRFRNYFALEQNYSDRSLIEFYQ